MSILMPAMSPSEIHETSRLTEALREMHHSIAEVWHHTLPTCVPLRPGSWLAMPVSLFSLSSILVDGLNIMVKAKIY